MNGHERRPMYMRRERLRTVQRMILFALAGAWSVDFLLNPSAFIAQALNWAILVLIIFALLLQLLLMSKS